jgi:hypothetical protein
MNGYEESPLTCSVLSHEILSSQHFRDYTGAGIRALKEKRLKRGRGTEVLFPRSVGVVYKRRNTLRFT